MIYWPCAGDEAEGTSWVSVFLPCVRAESFGSVTLGQVRVTTDALRAESALSSFISSAPRSQTFVWDQIPWLPSSWMGCCDLAHIAMVGFEYCFWIVPKKKEKLSNTYFNLIWNFNLAWNRLFIYTKLFLFSFLKCGFSEYISSIHLSESQLWAKCYYLSAAVHEELCWGASLLLSKHFLVFFLLQWLSRHKTTLSTMICLNFTVFCHTWNKQA